MNRRVVVTGGGGFVGQWLARTLLRRGDAVWLAGRERDLPDAGILTPGERRSLTWLPTDIRSEADLATMLATADPDLIIHLAGISYVPEAERTPVAAYEVNVLGAVRLMAAVTARCQEGGRPPTILAVGSGTQYGAQEASAMPLTEEAPLRPNNVYAATKAAQEIAVLQMARVAGLRAICTRSFSHSGAGQAAEFLLPALTRRVRALGPGDSLVVGNDAVRDYLHIEDVVDAYLALCDRGVTGEVYNVCSGEGVSVRTLAADVLSQAGRQAEIVSEPGLQRPSDIPVLVGSPARIHRDTGWRPSRSRREIIRDLLNAG